MDTDSQECLWPTHYTVEVVVTARMSRPNVSRCFECLVSVSSQTGGTNVLVSSRYCHSNISILRGAFKKFCNSTIKKNGNVTNYTLFFSIVHQVIYVDLRFIAALCRHVLLRWFVARARTHVYPRDGG